MEAPPPLRLSAHVTEDAGVPGVSSSKHSPFVSGQRVPVNIITQCCPPDLAMRTKWAADNFVIKHRLGQGFASQVYLAVDTATRRTVALKVYSKSKLTPMYQHQVFREIVIHSKMRHENIVQLYGAFEDAAAFYLVMEFAPGGDLYSHFKRAGGRYSEACVVRSILKPFLSALQYIHSMDVIHRDIKPENCVLSADGVVKLTDFGLSIEVAHETATTRLGTLDYMAPEVASNPDTLYVGQHRGVKELQYGASVDAWAVGTLAYEMLIGRPPFWASNKAKQVQNIQSATVLFPPWVSETSQDFIRAALIKDPTKRLGITEMLQHAWLQMAPSNSLVISRMHLSRHESLEPAPTQQHTDPENALRSGRVEQPSALLPPMSRWAGGINAAIGGAVRPALVSPSPFEGTTDADHEVNVCNLRNIRSAVALLNHYGTDEHNIQEPRQVNRGGASPLPGSSPPQPITMVRQGLYAHSGQRGFGRLGPNLLTNSATHLTELASTASASATTGSNNMFSPTSPGPDSGLSSRLPATPQAATAPCYGGVIMGGAGMGSAPVKMKSLVDELLASESESRQGSAQLFGASALSDVGHRIRTRDSSSNLEHMCQRRIRMLMGDVTEEDSSSVSPPGKAPKAVVQPLLPPRPDAQPWSSAAGSHADAAGVSSSGGSHTVPSSVFCASRSGSHFTEALASVPEVEKSVLGADSDACDVLTNGSDDSNALVTHRLLQNAGGRDPVRPALRRASTHAWTGTADTSPKQPMLKQRSALTLALSPSSWLPECSRLASLELASDEFGAGSDSASPQGPELLGLQPALRDPAESQQGIDASPAACAFGKLAASVACSRDVASALTSACRQLNDRQAARDQGAAVARFADGGLDAHIPDVIASERETIAPTAMTRPSGGRDSDALTRSKSTAPAFPLSPAAALNGGKVTSLTSDLILHRSLGRRASTGGGVWGMAFSSIKSHVVRLARRTPMCDRHRTLRLAFTAMDKPDAGSRGTRRGRGEHCARALPRGLEAVVDESLQAADEPMSLPALPTVHAANPARSLLDLARSISQENAPPPPADAPRYWSEVLSLLPPTPPDDAPDAIMRGPTRAKTTTVMGDPPSRGRSPGSSARRSSQAPADPTRRPDLAALEKRKPRLAERDDTASAPNRCRSQYVLSSVSSLESAPPASEECPESQEEGVGTARALRAERKVKHCAIIEPTEPIKFTPGTVAKRKKKLFWKQHKQSA